MVFRWYYKVFLVPEGLQVGLQLRAKLEVVLGGVLVACWSDLGMLSGGQNAPKMAQDGAKMRPRRPKTAQDRRRGIDFGQMLGGLARFVLFVGPFRSCAAPVFPFVRSDMAWPGLAWRGLWLGLACGIAWLVASRGLLLVAWLVACGLWLVPWLAK